MSQKFSSQSTDSFRELLNKSECTLLVSTYQAGQLVLIRAQDKGINTHFMGVNRPMGIATRKNEFALGGQSTISIFRNLPAVGSKTGQGEQVDACYLKRKTRQTGAIDIHEMGYDNEGTLWFINTKMSCLATMHDEFSFVPQWRPPFITAYDLTDRCHLNGLGFRDGKPKYVTMLGAYDTPGGWRQNKISGGQVMDLETNEVLADGLCMPHSPRWYRGKLYFLSSGSGELMSLTPGESPEVVAELPGFARGMDFIDHYALIGLSQIRESSTFAGLPLTKRVEKRESGVWVVDLETGKIVAYLVFTGSVQEVFEIKVLPHKFATVIDEDSPLVASSYELPDEVLNNLAPVDETQVNLEKATHYHMEGKFDEAISLYKEILQNDNENRMAFHHLGLCYMEAKNWQKAIEQLTRVVEKQSDNAEAMNSLGYCYSEIRETEKAMRWYNESIATDHQFAHAHFNRSLLLLKNGQYKEGWEEYDWRWQTPQFVQFQCNQPQWQGEDISDKRLLVHSEQGNGDHIQYLRFLSIVAKKCKELIYIGPENLSALVAEIPGVTESRIPGQLSSDRFDVWCPLMSLTRWLNVESDNIPAPKRYLSIPAQATVSQLKGDFKIGISWAGSKTLKNDSLRSTTVETFERLLDIKGISLFSLQMPISNEERSFLELNNIVNLESELPGYARTAALIDQLDLIISVDTAVVHVAAALGKKTWTMLSNNSDWRWMESGINTPWYPSMRLYRQAFDQSDWSDVMSKIKTDLQLLINDIGSK